MRTRIQKESKKTLVFTTNVEKVPTLEKMYGKSFKNTKMKTNKTKADIAKENLNRLFT